MFPKISLLRLLRITFILMIGFILLPGCNNGNSSFDKEKDVNDYAPYSDDVVEEEGKATNFDLFENFLKNVDEGKEDNIRIVRYTSEGDPIIQDLKYDTDNIIVTIDSSKDEYGDGNLNNTSCKSISKNKTDNGISIKWMWKLC